MTSTTMASPPLLHSTTSTTTVVPKLGPEPILLSRKEVDVLYEILNAVRTALDSLGVSYVVTGGTLLGAVRQHSILFCDDDIDLAVIEKRIHDEEEDEASNSIYESVVVPHLQTTLGDDFVYQIRPWEGGDRVRAKRMSNVFLDLFVLRRYKNWNDLKAVVGLKKNGQVQSETYVHNLIDTISKCGCGATATATTTTMDTLPPQEKLLHPPFWHFSTRKAIEMWPKEVYRDQELFPLDNHLKFGPLVNVSGPHMPVRLLKRAFGDDCFDVYYQSVSHKNETGKKKKPSTTTIEQDHKQGCIQVEDENNSRTDSALPPLVAAGGTWEGGQKVPLKDIHYLPMQPMSRVARRPTMHCRERLMEYLERQTKVEESYRQPSVVEHRESSSTLQEKQKDPQKERPNRTVYTDGVFDLFHGAHLKAIQQCAELGTRVIVGITGDADATGYKRQPIVPQEERAAIVLALGMVDRVVCPCPLVVTREFMDEYGIDLVVHGFANDADIDKQREFFDIPMKMGKFQRIPYTHGVSTTDRIQLIQQLVDEEQNGDKGISIDNPQWFGATLAAATNFASSIPTDPFPLQLRLVIESHLDKARKRRHDALHAIRRATGEDVYDTTMKEFQRTLGKEGDISVDKQDFQLLLDAFYESANLPPALDLSRIHEHLDSGDGIKLRLLQSLTENHQPCQDAFDVFVQSVCIPHFVSLLDESPDEVYYQAFPCLRIVQPNEFSIGPHADVSYGHHPCSVNYYLPLTSIGGTSSLFLEGRPGAEDWHCIEQDLLSRDKERSVLMKHFAGAICVHWTTENKTASTRVSLDFRIIAGSDFNRLQCGGHLHGGQLDVYRKAPGYYSKCIPRGRVEDGGLEWKREGPLMSPPDARIGFPWTVKDWDKVWKKQTQS